jgi:SAM-dependent methyltransferase
MSELPNVWVPEPGQSTAHPLNVSYRVGRIAPLLRGRWIDLGCADGGYAAALLESGVEELLGFDVDAARVAVANERNLSGATFSVSKGEALDAPSGAFDGVWMNEVFEHVTSEDGTLAEIYRVLRPRGLLILISPNRWFPFEGHGMKLHKFAINHPIPVLPWLPSGVSRKVLNARNYWPREIIAQVRRAGFIVEQTGFVWPVLEQYPWLPSWLRTRYQRRIRSFDSLPILKRFGVSTLVVARKQP